MTDLDQYKQLSIIRVISGFGGDPDRFYDLTDMPWKESHEFIEHFKRHGYHVQNIFMEDPMMVRVAMEIEKRDKEAKKD